MGREIIANIFMFVPFGFLLTSCLEKKYWDILFVLLLAPVFSLIIETMQLLMLRGLFEWDDLINNSVGAMAGWLLYKGIKRVIPQKNLSKIVVLIYLVSLGASLIVYMSRQKENNEQAGIYPRNYCFQIDEVKKEGDILSLTGFQFFYERKPSDIIIILKATDTGKSVRLETECGIFRPDVQRYFQCESDYSKSGFFATGEIDSEVEYEVLIKWPWSVPIPAGVYITGTDIQYCRRRDFIAPQAEGTDLEDIINSGTLRVYRPDFRCWVYQLDSKLYWITDQDFYFEDDGTTYIQYQLWTTQPANLPKKRLEMGCLWDNIGGYFEKYELNGNYGKYRVSCREIPKDYSITAIITGYYDGNGWVWQNYFRPLYDF